SARDTLLILTATRWFPTGLVIGVMALLPIERGLSLSQLGVLLSVQGLVVLGLELPTGGLADAIGRRRVLLLAALMALASAVVFVTAHSMGVFVLALVLQGVHRALDSGPLEAWYVDAAQADDPEVRVEHALARAGTVLGLSIASGALVSGALVAWHPVPSMTALELPFWVAVGFLVVNLVMIALRLRESRTPLVRDGASGALGSAGEAARTVVAGLRLLSAAPVLRALVLVEVFWATALIAFETLVPVRLSELVGGTARAGALMGPASAAAWGLFAVGSALAGSTSRRIGVARTALLARVLNGAAAVVMGVMAGPVGLITAFLLGYTLHGGAGPMHATLLHREARADNRTTVLSMNSMVAGGAYTVGLLVMGPAAEHTSTALVIGAAGAFSILGALLYLPAVRREG
ncbi:MFS transporter, partial [Actinotalea sp.]|uniref:MFS transporter n=1 Tax=Actinotalea sp. TaxID=1872145 RepID=UPI0035644140